MEYVHVPGAVNDAIRAGTGDDTLDFVCLLNGHFAVVKRITKCGVVPADGELVTFGYEEPYLVHEFDGRNGEPLPGQWFIDAMLETDRCRRSYERDREVDERMAELERQKQRRRDSFAEQYARNDIMFNAFAQEREKYGVTSDADEIKRMEESIEREKESRAKVDEFDYKIVKYRSARSSEELF